MTKKGPAVIGIILIMIGGLFLASQFVPELSMVSLWPMIVLGVGIVFIIMGFIGKFELLIPGTIVSYIGSILLFKSMTQGWSHWQLWLLVPSSVGVGILMSNLLKHKDMGKALKDSWFLIVLGLGLFTIFTFKSYISKIWPAFIILAGVLILLQGFLGVKRNKQKEQESDTIDGEHENPEDL